MIAVLWGLDEALLDTAAGRRHALGCAIDECTGGRVDGQALAEEHGERSIEQLAWTLLGEDFPRLTETFDRHYAQLSTPTCVHAGVAEVLDTLVAEQVPMAALSLQPSWSATEELSRCGLLRYFQSVVGADDTDVHQPEPDPVFEALDRMAVDAGEEVFVVGATGNEVRAAKRAGCRSIGALWATGDPAQLRETRPDFVAAEPSEVLNILHQASHQ
jgi:pyrophosphatase PpaX